MQIRLAEDRDVPEIMAVMTEAHEAMADPSAYLTDPEDYVRDHVSRRGFILLGEQDGFIAGFFMVSLPGLGETWDIPWISRKRCCCKPPLWIPWRCAPVSRARASWFGF